MNQTYTVFSEHGFQPINTDDFQVGLNLAEFIAACSEEMPEFDMIAWAPETPIWYGGTKSVSALRAESIAAGRLIEKVDGKYVARGLDNPAWTQAVEGAAQKYMGNHSPMIATAPEEKLASVKVCEEQKPPLTLGEVLRRVLERPPIIKPVTLPDLEPKRPRLTWADTKPFNNFEGYEVTSGSSDVLHTLADGVHPLQKMAEGKEGFGSAALLKG